MQEVAFVVDSTAYAGEEFLASGKVWIVPLQVIMGEDSFLENQGMSNSQFLQYLREAPKTPTTSQPSVGAFLEVYGPLVKEGKAIISIHLSGGLSGTVRAAQQAAGMVEGGEIHVVDSGATSVGMLFQLAAAMEAAAAGKGVAGALAAIEEVKASQRLLILVDSLQHLQKGGRIGGAQALLGNLLQIKPILTVREGKVDVFDKVRTRSKALLRIVDEMKKDNAIRPIRRIAIAHAENEELVAGLKSLIDGAFPGMQAPVHEIGPVIATHSGPGALGVFYY